VVYRYRGGWVGIKVLLYYLERVRTVIVIHSYSYTVRTVRYRVRIVTQYVHSYTVIVTWSEYVQ
jgi:hypothetical protein